MPENVRTETIRVADMTCVSCERRIEKKLTGTPGISDAKASFSDGSVRVVYDPGVLDIRAVENLVGELGYHAAEKGRGSDFALRAAYTIAALCALYAVLSHFGLLDVFYKFPEARTGMSYGTLFTIGLFTSVHCVAMCGGINLSQSLSARPARFSVIRSGLLYNLGRAVSYTLIGGAAGALGAAVTPSGSLRGVVQLAAGGFMVLMGLNMLNIFPRLRSLIPRMPKIFGDKIHARAGNLGNGPLYVGLLNGFMPCGPLQAMQLYALSTGSFAGGALSMFFFSAGTLPLMFGLSALSSFLSQKFTRSVMTAGAAMVVLLGAAMFAGGMGLTGLSPGTVSAGSGTAASARAESGLVQLVRTELKPGRYDPIKVQAGIPVRWTIHAEPGTVNGCNNELVIPEYNRLQKRLRIGDNIVEFTPERIGTFTYTCWMGMIRGRITVIEGDAGNQTAAAASLPPISAGDGLEKNEAGYDADPFAELFK